MANEKTEQETPRTNTEKQENEKLLRLMTVTTNMPAFSANTPYLWTRGQSFSFSENLHSVSFGHWFKTSLE